MNRNALRRLRVKAEQGLFFASEVVRSRLATSRRMKILFFRKDGSWEKTIARGFRLTPHEISFGEICPDDVQRCDMVVPLTVDHARKLNDMRHLIRNNPLPIPGTSSIDLCDDKYVFHCRLMRDGFSEHVPSIGEDTGFPYFLKKRIDEWGRNTHFIRDSRQEQAHVDRLNDRDYFRQAAVFGEREYATHIVVREGRIVCSLNIEYAFDCEFPIKGKDRPIYRGICGCPHLELFLSVLNSLGFEGLCCVNYKHVHRRPAILEINPRFGGSLCRYFFSFVRHLM